MREIKFRVWDNTNKNMRYDIAAIDFGLNRISFKNLENRIASENYREFWYLPYELMQYTGLQDKNGREIYEGDIIALEVIKGVKIKVPVKFENGSFNIHEIPGGYGFSDTAYPLGKLFLRDFGIEVIGNAYENKELLEEK